MKGRVRGLRYLLLPVLVVAAVWCVFTGMVLAGVATRSAVRAQDQLLQSASDVSAVLADAGRAEALVASIGDPKTNPATVDRMRAELTELARSIHAQSLTWRRHLADRPGSGSRFGPGAGADEVFSVAVQGAGPQLLDLSVHFSETAARAAAPQAQVAPGQLLRGNLDGDYPVLRSQALAVHERLRAAAAAADDSWSRLVVVVLTATATVGIILSWLVLGPVRRRLTRQRRDADLAQAAREEALNTVRRVLNSLDVPVLVVDTDGTHVDANAAAQARFAFLHTERTRVADLPDELFLAADGHRIGWRELPITQVLRSNAAVSALVTVRSSPGDTASGTRDRRYSVDVQPVHDSDGRILGAVASFQDITELHARAEHHARHASQLATIRQATSAILRQDDARAAVCEAARSVAGAALATLFEDDGHGDLVCTAAAGADVFGMRLPIAGRSITATTFALARSHTANTLDGQQDLDGTAVASLARACGQPLQAGAWIPVTTTGRCRAVLALGFTHPQPVEDYLPTLEVLAGEAAVALDRQDLIRRLAQDAEIDPLTGAANRRAWDTHLATAINTAAAAGRPFSLIMLDLDHFKAYNDTHGHPAGDGMLRRTATAWRDRLRPNDILARYGGEEFVALLPDCTLPDARKLADDLRRLVPDQQTCSAGVAQHIPGEDPITLVTRADTALYQAKNNGRNRTAIDRGA